MIPTPSCTYSVHEIAKMVGATVVGAPVHPIQRVSIDSRDCAAGSLFVPLQGEHADGHDYIANAATLGATAAFVRKDLLVDIRRKLSASPMALIGVDSPLCALQRFAAAHVDKFSLQAKVGVTGSCGKTTTKELIASILSQSGETMHTPGNLNSEIGLPLSLLSIGPTTRFGVYEMGVDHVGEMDSMLSVYRPDYGILTNIGISHLGKMGSMQAIADEKSRIFHPGISKGFISDECSYRSWMEQARSCSLTPYGLSCTPGVNGVVDLGIGGWDICYEQLHMHLACVGKHSLSDALGAIALCREIGSTPQEIQAGIEAMVPVAGRSNILGGNVTIIEDCYNASLDSTGGILEYLRNVRWNGQKKVVLGSMKELGSMSVSAHQEIGRRILAAAPSSVFLYGSEMSSAWDVLMNNGYGSYGKLLHTNDFDELQQAVGTDVHAGDLFLLKGSRSMAMERLLPILRKAG